MVFKLNISMMNLYQTLEGFIWWNVFVNFEGFLRGKHLVLELQLVKWDKSYCYHNTSIYRFLGFLCILLKCILFRMRQNNLSVVRSRSLVTRRAGNLAAILIAIGKNDFAHFSLKKYLPFAPFKISAKLKIAQMLSNSIFVQRRSFARIFLLLGGRVVEWIFRKNMDQTTFSIQ